MSALLEHVPSKPDPDLLTAINLKAARTELGLAADTPANIRVKRGDVKQTLFAFSAQSVLYGLTLLNSDLNQHLITAAVSVSSSGPEVTLIGTRESATAIKSELRRNGYRRYRNEWSNAPVPGVTVGAGYDYVALFPGGVAESKVASATAAAAAAHNDGAAEFRKLSARLGGPPVISFESGPFVGPAESCVGAEMLSENLAPHTGTLTAFLEGPIHASQIGTPFPADIPTTRDVSVGKVTVAQAVDSKIGAVVFPLRAASDWPGTFLNLFYEALNSPASVYRCD